MHFFEKPKQVTAIVFFIQTIIALLNMKHFLYLGSYFFIVTLLFVGFPFLFYYIYNHILNDLDKDKSKNQENPEMIYLNKDKDTEPIAVKEEQVNKVFESPENKPGEKLEVEVAAKAEVLLESSGDLEQMNLEESVKVVEPLEPTLEPEQKASPRMSRVEARKQIQVIDFVDEEPAPQEEKVVPVIEPVFIRKEKPHRKKRKQEALKEANPLTRGTFPDRFFFNEDEDII